VNLLLDTHTAFWSIVEPSRLSTTGYAAIEAEENEVYVSVASAWEMAIKVGIGKWPQARALVDDFEHELSKANIRLLPISVPHVRKAGLLPSAHRDPFDRLIAAQALTEGLTLVTADMRLRALGAPWLW
jgi:PIN domain nuclease of toxin-antitoxin system